MQPNRVWIAVLLVMFFAVSLTITAEGQESGTPNDAVWQRADELLKKLNSRREASVDSLQVSLQCLTRWRRRIYRGCNEAPYSRHQYVRFEHRFREHNPAELYFPCDYCSCCQLGQAVVL